MAGKSQHDEQQAPSDPAVELRREWKRLKKVSINDRISFLARSGVVAFGSQDCKQKLKSIEKAIHQIISTSPSITWIDDQLSEDVKLPRVEVRRDERGRAVVENHADGSTTLAYVDGRRFAVRLRLSKCGSRIGEENRLTRRWTPPQAVAVEDELDALDANSAASYKYSPSVSAENIHEIARFRAGPEPSAKDRDLKELNGIERRNWSEARREEKQRIEAQRLGDEEVRRAG